MKLKKGECICQRCDKRAGHEIDFSKVLRPKQFKKICLCQKCQIEMIKVAERAAVAGAIC